MPIRSLQPLLVTVALLIFPFALLAVAPTREGLIEVLFALPYGILFLVAFLGLKLNQRRIGSLGLALVVACGFLQWALPRETLGVSVEESARWFAVALPLFYCSLFLLPRKLGWLCALPTFALLLCLKLFPPSRAILQLHFSSHGPLLGVPDLALGFALIFAAMTLLEKDKFLRDFRVFTALTFVPFFYILTGPATRAPASEAVKVELVVIFLSVGSLLLYAILRLYWQKVFIDDLTGVANRRALNDQLARTKGTFSVAMIDIDHFKDFNDTYGHDQGDHVLRFVAQFVRRFTGHRCYRYGGEEFCLILEDTDGESALREMESLREKLANETFHIRKPRLSTSGAHHRGQTNSQAESLRVTISIGVGTPGETARTAEDVLIRADRALYQAKAQGRNRALLSA